jgi:hypothetical protein
LGTPARAASVPNGTITRSEVLARAQNWVDRNVKYNKTRRSNTLITDVEGDNRYGPDCSGLVSMAWHITANSGKGGNSTSDFLNYSSVTRLGSMHDLRPGDAILRDGHMELFARWKDAGDHAKGAWTYSLNGTGDPDSNGWENDWAKGPAANSHGQRGDESWSSMANNYIPIRYDRITDDPPPVQGKVSVYGVLPDGRLTYTAIDAATGRRTHGAVTSTATLGFTPKAMATLNFNTILITEDGPEGKLYRIDVITNNTSLGFHPPVLLGTGFTHDHLAYDGNTNLFGIAGGVLRRYPVNATKPARDNILTGALIGHGFTLKTLTTTASNWILGTTADGRLISYRINGAENYTRFQLRDATWQAFTNLLSPGGGVYYGHRPEGSLHRYLDHNPHDGNADDLTGQGTVDTTGWTQTLLSAQPATVS